MIRAVTFIPWPELDPVALCMIRRHKYLVVVSSSLLADLVEYLVDRIKQPGGLHFGHIQGEESLR